MCVVLVGLTIIHHYHATTTTERTVYCTSVEKLIAIPIWEQQRIYRPERAQLLAQDIKAKLQDGKPLTLPGVSTRK